MSNQVSFVHGAAMCIMLADKICATGAKMKAKRMAIVPRTSSDERTFAVVQWHGVNEHEVREAITNALTEWMNTDEGKESYANSGASCSGDYNIGDLSVDLSSESPVLNTILVKHGVRALEVECYCTLMDDIDQGWNFDTILVRFDPL
jgi:hypothetical protein